MRQVIVGLIVLTLAACGGSSAVHYNVGAALDCVQRTNSTSAAVEKDSIAVVFLSDDGMSAVEPVFVSFGPTTVTGRVPIALNVNTQEPVWTEKRGDALVAGYGPYEPPIARRQKIPAAQAQAAARKLGIDVRAAIDDCLKKNER